MELRDTVEMMISDDAKERFKAEYFQLKIRIKKLRAMIENNLDIELNCPVEILQRQLEIMENYRALLGMRATLEGIYFQEGDAEDDTDHCGNTERN